MFRVFCIICSLVFLQACATSENVQKTTTEPIKSAELTKFDSTLQGRDFYNQTLPVSLTLPEGWLVEKQDKSTHVIDNDKALKVLKPKSLRKATVTVLSITQPARVSTYANLSLIISKRKASGKLPLDFYNKQLKKTLKETGRYDFIRPESKKELAGQTYSILPGDTEVRNFKIKQDYYATFVDGKRVVFLLTYTGEDGLNIMEGILKSASFVK